MYDYSKKLLASAAFALACVFPVAASAAETVNQRPTLSVDGVGVVEAMPDTATIELGVRTTAKTAAEAQKQNALASSAVQTAIKALGISPSDIMTQNYSFYPSYGNDNVITTYNASNTILVSVNNINNVGKVIDTALANGANQVEDLTFALKDRSILRKEALTAAAKDAREKADFVAAALGKRIIGIQQVTIHTTESPYGSYRNLMLAKSSTDEASTPIATPTKLKNTESLRIDFLLSED